LDFQVREAEFAVGEVFDVVGDDGFGIPRQGQFDQVVVVFVGEIRAPQEVDLDPFRDLLE